MNLLTAKELGEAAHPELPVRRSPRRSSSKTNPVSPRTFSGLVPWPNFMQDVIAFGATIDNQTRKYVPPNLRSARYPVADENGVRGALECYLYPDINQMARDQGIPFIYADGGSGRSYSYTDSVILDASAALSQGSRVDLSARVYGNGEIKGPWQWEMQGPHQLDDAMRIPKDKEKIESAIQQMYGDMVMDETRYGFVSNYNQTIFFRRSNQVTCKALELSPVVSITDAPIQAFLFVLAQAHQDMALKNVLKRELVPVTPSQGYALSLPPLTLASSSKGRAIKRCLVPIHIKATGKRRKQNDAYLDLSGLDVPVVHEEDFGSLPDYSMRELGLSGRIVGMGKFGNVLEGTSPEGIPLAIKTFDLQLEKAAMAFVNEQIAYKTLKQLQGFRIPLLIAIGRLPHCDVVYLVLSDEGNINFGNSGVTRRQRISALKALDDIHAQGVLHGDLNLSHVLLNRELPKFIDFEKSMHNQNPEAYISERRLMKELLEE